MKREYEKLVQNTLYNFSDPTIKVLDTHVKENILSVKTPILITLHKFSAVFEMLPGI